MTNHNKLSSSKFERLNASQRAFAELVESKLTDTPAKPHSETNPSPGRICEAPVKDVSPFFPVTSIVYEHEEEKGSNYYSLTLKRAYYKEPEECEKIILVIEPDGTADEDFILVIEECGSDASPEQVEHIVQGILELDTAQ